MASLGLADYRFKSLADFWRPLLRGRLAERCAPRKELEEKNTRGLQSMVIWQSLLVEDTKRIAHPAVQSAQLLRRADPGKAILVVLSLSVVGFSERIVLVHQFVQFAMALLLLF